MEPWNRNIVDEKYFYYLNGSSDINEHLPIFYKYGKECDVIVELGCRWVVSTWAWLKSKPKKLISIDIEDPKNWGTNDLELAYSGAKQNGVDFEFRLENTLTNEIEQCDLLFVDTWHSYNQVKQELSRHGNKSNKYIILHDTEHFNFNDMDNDIGIWPAIEEFLDLNPHWYVHEKYANNNGITILKRKNELPEKVKHSIDVICLTNTYNESIHKMTIRTIKKLRTSEKNTNFNIILIESNKENTFEYADVDIFLKPDEPFNYNKYLNIANEYLKSDWVLVTNNDVVYEKNWFSEILKVHSIDQTIESFSPKELIFYSTFFTDHFGTEMNDEIAYWTNYKVSEGLLGWSLIMKRRVWDIVYPWDEQFDFYYQDNDYAKIIEANGVKHALVRDSLALHLGNIPLLNQTFDKNRNSKMEEGYKKYLNKWGG